MVNRGQIATAASFACLACVAAGCELVLGALPTPREDLPATTSTSSTSDGGTTASVATGGSTSRTSTQGSGGSSTSSTGGAPSTSSSCEKPCDCDEDGFDSALECAGDDCDDTSKKAYPEEPTYYDFPRADGSFDWDCVNGAELKPEWKTPVDCTKQVIGLGCNTSTGFLGKTVPPCGETGNWGTCIKTLVGCVEQVIEMKKMACK